MICVTLIFLNVVLEYCYLLFICLLFRLGHTAMAHNVFHVILVTTVLLLQMHLNPALKDHILTKLGLSPARLVMLDIPV